MATVLAENAKILALAEIEESSRGTNFTLGKGSSIDSFVKVKMTGGVENIFIGENSAMPHLDSLGSFGRSPSLGSLFRSMACSKP